MDSWSGILGTGAVVLALIVIFFILLGIVARYYKKVPPNSVAVVTGRNHKVKVRGADGVETVVERGFRYVSGGGFCLVPIVEEMEKMSLTVIPVEVSVKDVPDKNGALVNVNGICNIKVMSTDDLLPLAIERFLGKRPEEIKETCFMTLEGNLRGVIGTLADEVGRVFLPCVSGNHGRDTVKIWGKDRHATSFDWLLYCLLAKHFEGDKRITFYIPDGPDAYYRVFGHRYLLTHGDQFRGGDGVIGALGPIIRGDHRKRSRNGQIDMAYDTMLIGHWHQLIQLTRLIVNGSLKGYDEYAYSNNFGFERPQQALWLTHPQHGITFSMPVHCDRHRQTAPKTSWVAVAA